jgi:hypothetical protein
MKDANYNDVVSYISQSNDADEVRKIQEIAWHSYKAIREREASRVHWHEGMLVQLKPEHRGSRPYGAVGKIKKVNPKKVIVDYGISYPLGFNMPKPMVQEADEAAKKKYLEKKPIKRSGCLGNPLQEEAPPPRQPSYLEAQEAD